ncbi:MAG: sigma-54-dependent Fis family transcriptional regulator [Magnetococcales bacterium]|nr:sigma-54-dependent Fis family transcriptional regulator [Magnetococcales bacterium]MBF0323202.1 sigma-54-dependent Fis family transcriptional regulator [Magnetococcales bacterium]
MKNGQTILLVEDSESMAAVYIGYLHAEPWEVGHVRTGQEAMDVLAGGALPDLLLLDLKLPDGSGMEILRHIHQNSLPVSVVIITGYGSVDSAVEALRLGASDYLEKPFSANRLLVTLKNAMEHRRLSGLLHDYRKNFDRRDFHGFIGSSALMQGVYRIIESVAPSRASVFITGESGSGKEICAEAIHRQSQRRDKPLIAINCAAIPRNLLESEIFGHVRGSFSGAISDRAGAASRAHEGSLFLDEICELDFELQSKLLRFIQTGTFQKVGGSHQEVVDIRFICATNKDPWQEVQAGRFREDLFFRLNVIPIHLPPLRERGNDVLLIANRFLETFSREEGKKFKAFSREAERLLLENPWPGNVRQLQNSIRRGVVLCEGEVIVPSMLSLEAGAPSPQVRPEKDPDGKTPMKDPFSPDDQGTQALQESPEAIRPLWQVEMEAIERAIRLCGGNIPQAASRLEINPSTIYRKKLRFKNTPT